MVHERNVRSTAWGRRLRRATLATVACLGVLGIGAGAAQAGPVVLMGIDAEDGGVGGHGPISVYQNVVSNGVLNNVTNGGTGILVIGAGKTINDNVTAFWTAVDGGVAGSMTFVNGAANISSRSFAGFAAIAVASSNVETPSGGLTAAENSALAGRASDIASFVNGGGGLFGLSQTGLPAPSYSYLPNANLFTFNTGQGFDNITPTLAGNGVGITDALDVCCWHDEYLTFPSYLTVLATNAANGRAAALGGAQVVVPTDVTLTPPSATNPVGTQHTVTATIAKQGVPQAGVLVTFGVNGANAGAAGSCNPLDCKTDAGGKVSFTYTGVNAGTDTITASFVDASGKTVTGSATKLWVAAAKISINDVTVNEGNTGTTPATFKVTLDQASGAQVTVSYATANGTATAGSDYVAKTGTVTFAPGDTSEDVTVLVNGDVFNEPDETFVVNLSLPAGATIADLQGVGAIVDDERNGQFSCRASALNVLGLLEPVVANNPNLPCRDGTAGLVSAALTATGLSAAANAPNAKTDQTPNDLLASPPAVGDNATAHADTAATSASLFGLTATATDANATAACTSAGAPTLTTSGRVVGLVVNGVPRDVGTRQTEIPLLLATLKLNNTTRTGTNSIRRRAIWLDNAILPDVVIGEATAGFEGNPCDS
jgi:hypothetical protein